jgi:MEMO1 family protein
MSRKPAVADVFYPADAKALSGLVENFLKKAHADRNASGRALSVVAPHAGYVYSGQVAAYSYAALAESHKKRKFDSLVIVGPNHTGRGEPISVSMQDWETPLGTVRNDAALSRRIIDHSELVSEDEDAHEEEHSVEVQLPFVQVALGDVPCVFVCMGDQSPESAELLCRAILSAAKGIRRNVAVVASSDFDHYEPASVAKGKDLPAIEAIGKLDVSKFNGLLAGSGDTACGYGPISVAAGFAKECGAKEGRLLKYANSGDATKDYSSVVAYASIAFV